MPAWRLSPVSGFVLSGGAGGRAGSHFLFGKDEG
jgi:hypothetical protein